MDCHKTHLEYENHQLTEEAHPMFHPIHENAKEKQEEVDEAENHFQVRGS